MLLGDLVKRNAKLYPNKTAVIFKNSQYTYKELEDRVNRVAWGLRGIGIKKGDRVGVLSRPSSQFIELYLAIPKIGGVLVPLNCRFTGRELAHIINDSEMKSLISDKEFAGTIQLIQPDLNYLSSFYVVSDKPDFITSYEELVSDFYPETFPGGIEDDDLAVLMYTSGTTGNPKGVMLTHKNLISMYMSRIIDLKLDKNDIFLNCVPLYHTAAEYALLVLYVGGTIIIHSDFDPEHFLKDMEANKITFCLGVPAMVNFLLQHMEKTGEDYDFSSVRFFLYGAAPMPVALLKKAMKTFNCDFLHSYGLTEASPGVCLLMPEEHIMEGSDSEVKRLASCGKEIFNVEVKVVNKRGASVKPDEIGEIIVKGDNVMKGYWRLPEETSQAIKNGWLYTGDLATVDNEGYIFIVDRKKDMIISGGENIYPREIEEVLYTHPDILEAAVIGIPDEKWGEAVKAFVVVKKGKELLEKAVIDFCVKNLAGYKKPASVEFISVLPRNPVGKVLKKRLRGKYWKNYENRYGE